MENKQQKILSFLLDFPNYHWKIITSTEAWEKELWDSSINKSLKEVLRVNEEFPSWVYFTPNGNYGLVNEEWWVLKIDPIHPWHWCWFNAFVLNFNNLYWEEDFLERIKKKILNFTILKWRYIIKSPHGYHVYFVIEKEDKEFLFNQYWYALLSITKELWKFLWADVSQKNIQPWALFRFPYSKYWDVTQKYSCDIVDIQECYVTKKDVLDCIWYLKDIQKRNNACKKLLSWKHKNVFLDLLKKDINDVINFCKGEWQEINTANNIIIDNVIAPYFGKNIFENPSWNIIEYLYSISKWSEEEILNKLKTISLFKDLWEEKISFDFWDIDNDEDNNQQEEEFTLKVWDDSFVFKENEVLYKFVSNWKNIKKVVFRDNIKIIWRWEQTVWPLFSEWQANKNVFYIQVNWDDKILYETDSKKDFYKKNWLFFFGTDNDLWLFFNVLSKDRQINDVTICQRNWYYNNVCVLWDRVVAWEWSKNNLVLLWENGFELCDKKQIPVKESFTLLRQYYEDELIVPLFLATIALCWMNLWNVHEIYPSVLLTWTTWSGKSTLADLLRQICWYWQESRRMTFRWLTEQPLKIAASDNAILCLEELTRNLWPVEQLVRNIINRDITSRWALDNNYTWKLRAPLFIVWERTFTDESLNNRCATFVMSDRYRNKKWWKWFEKINNVTSYEDIYSTFLVQKDNINSLALSKKGVLIDHGLSWRTADVWSYALVVNDIFNIWFNISKLIWYIKEHVWRLWLTSSTNTVVNPEIQLINFLRTEINKRKISFLIDVMDNDSDISYWTYKILFDFLDEDEYQKNRWFLNSAIIDINKKHWEDTITIDQYWIYFKTIDMIKKTWKSDDTWDDYIIQSTMMLLRQLWQRIISEYNWQQIIAVKDWITDYKKF